jgi:hypothetical protein
MRTFALPRTQILNIDTDEDSAKLHDAIRQALKRHDTFNLLRHGHMRGKPLPENSLVQIARQKLELPLTEGLVSWNNKQTLIDIDAQSANMMREQSGHQFFKIFAGLNHFAGRVRGAQAHQSTGFVAFWQSALDTTMVMSQEQAFC